MVKIEVSAPLSYTVDTLKTELARILPIEKNEIRDIDIVKRTLDVSCKSDIKYKMIIAASFSPEREAGLLKMRKTVFKYEKPNLFIPESSLSSPPVVVGSGPSGLFAALTLAKSGACPIVLERGLSVDERKKKVDSFSRFRILDEECNVQFGEGGAGTFSDGKLKSGAQDEYKTEVLAEFINAGAPEEIAYSVGAHLGTDKLVGIVKAIREKIISLGGKFIFGARFVDFKSQNGKIKAAVYEKGGNTHEIETENILLALGHSATDTFRMLYGKGVKMEARGFGVGMRIEHNREYINELCYGKNASGELGAASYHLVTHLSNGRSVYSFCMCPGGTVVAATSEKEGIVTNGMSEYARDAKNSNSAILVSVTPADFGSDSALAGFDYRKKIERAAYLAAGADYSAPAIRLDSFLNYQESGDFSEVLPSFSCGVSKAKPEAYLPSYISESIRAAMSDFDAWLPGFSYPAAALTGAETRSTSPIKIPRNESFEALGFNGLFPIGEGAGYAGGIISSARDGVRAAISLINNNSKNQKGLSH
ncbi:MAG: hypothetical protein IJW38_00905 [Clostridia bacterium]|nr:hypothetical protein [Clostridia bacterium]